MQRVLVITNNLNQASFRLRVEALIAPLAARGLTLDVQVRPRTLLARRQLLRSAGGYDAVLLQRKLLDRLDARLLRRHAHRIFFDVDDAVMYHNTPTGVLSRWRTWRRFVSTARNVDHVVAGNQYLADLFGREGVATSVLPTVVDTDHYSVKAHAPTPSPTLVWIGSKSTLPYVRRFLPALEEAAKRVPGLKLLIVADATLSSATIPIEHIPWSLAGEAEALCRGDIGIAPTPSDRWTLGKCGFKIVQYMAAGLPVVASPVGANAELVVPHKTGFLPKSLLDWPDALATLASNADLRARMGAAARRRAEQEYSLNRAASFWEKLLTSTPSGPGIL